ncbi:radical SAM protein [Azotobacter sp. CWF10]
MGEPLLAGREFFESALRLQRELRLSGQWIQNSLQTNGLLLDEEWLSFLSRNSFTVGVSVDAPGDVHDAARVDVNRRGTFREVVAKLRGLKHAGIDHGVILVARPDHVHRQKEILSCMREIGVSSFDIHPSCGNGMSSSFDISPSQFSSLCCELFDQWLNEGAGIAIPMFEDFLRYLSGRQPKTCYHAGRCTAIIAIEADGAVVPCTRPFESYWTFGNVLEQSLSSIIAGSRFQEFARRDLSAQHSRASCRWFGVCHNGCPQHRRSTIGSVSKATIDGVGIYCDCFGQPSVGWPAVYDHIEDRVRGTLGI